MKIFNRKRTYSRARTNRKLDRLNKEVEKIGYALGKHKRLQNIPGLDETILLPHILSIKTKCELVGLELLHEIQPAQHIPKGRLDSNLADLHHKRLEAQAEDINKEVRFLNQELEGYNPGEVQSRINKALAISGLIYIGEVILNSQAFEVWGDNLLFCIFLSCGVSIAIATLAHFSGRHYKDSDTWQKKLGGVLLSLGLIAIISLILAKLRVLFLSKIGIQIDLLSFAGLNLFFFAVSALATYLYFPTKEEIAKDREYKHKRKELKKLLKKLIKKVKEQVIHTVNSRETVNDHIDAPMEAEYMRGRLTGIFSHGVGIFTQANLTGCKYIPPCFHQPLPALDLPYINFHETFNNYKNPNNENNPSDYLG